MTAFRLGLTGSIGMGKSTTAAMFAEQGIPVWDADAAVRRLYAPDGAAAQAVANRYPNALAADGSVDRAALRALIAKDPTVLDWLNATVHPLTAKDRAQFITQHANAEIVLLDIPLLFETGAQSVCDAVVVVTAPAQVQRDRVLARHQMTGADLDIILARQMPDAEKRARADFVIETSSLDSASTAVKSVIDTIKARKAKHA